MCYQADFFSTAVRTGKPGMGGLSFLLIDKNDPKSAEGISVKHIKTSDVKAAATAWVYFDDCYVPVENLMGKETTILWLNSTLNLTLTLTRIVGEQRLQAHDGELQPRALVDLRWLSRWSTRGAPGMFSLGESTRGLKKLILNPSVPKSTISSRRIIARLLIITQRSPDLLNPRSSVKSSSSSP